jgi:hypothetical protein
MLQTIEKKLTDFNCILYSLIFSGIITSFFISIPVKSATKVEGSAMIKDATDTVYGYVEVFVNFCIAVCVISLIGILVSIAINVFKKESKTISTQIGAFIVLLLVVGVLSYIKSKKGQIF